MAMDFLAELKKVQLNGPRLGMLQLQALNSEYTFATDQCKNCYLIMNAIHNEDCMYGRDFYDNTDCVDCDHIADCQLCYECLQLKHCYNCTYLQDCDNCRDCDFGYDLKGCESCTGCVGLRKKKYHLFNQPLLKEQYEEKVKALKPQEIWARFQELKQTLPRLYAQIHNSEDCTGDYIYHSQRAHECFDTSECQDVGYLLECKNMKDSWDVAILEDSELCYEISSSHQLYNCNFCYMCIRSRDLEYCEFVSDSQHCFGCAGLVRKKFHIFNQPYSEEEYFKKVAEIKDELRAKGEYGVVHFPSTYPLEESVASWSRL